MNSVIYRGEVLHSRHTPIPHRFRYPLYFYGFDLDELPSLRNSTRLFGYNRRGIVSLHDRDYLDESPGTIHDKLRRLLARHGVADNPERVFLVTSARYLNYVFNPVSFYYCYGADGNLSCFLAEVNNTFRERHLYLLPYPRRTESGFEGEARKAFHVSPFNDMDGTYRFRFSTPRPALDVHVDIRRDERIVFESCLRGHAVPFQRDNLRTTLLRHPVGAALTFPRILAQAAVLYGRKKLRVYPKPPPSSEMTIRTAPATMIDRFCQTSTKRLLDRTKRGTLQVRLPTGDAWTFGGREPGVAAALSVRSPGFFTRIVRDGEIGFGEAYMTGEWTSDNPTAVVRFFIENQDLLDFRNIATAFLGEALNRVLHVARPNTQFGSKKNISAHYDLSNEFFSLWLDRTMMYSAAVYESPGDTLEDAQLRKLRRLIDRARIEPRHHVLEIGSGWGAFAIEAVRRTGCRVTSVTVSERQLEFARERAAEAGLADRIDFQLCDYRRVQGRFDRIVSIEMIEAVGHDYLGGYFANCERLLSPDGLLVLQAITIPDQRYEGYRKSVDWIQKHIFPGGHLPSLGALVDAMTRSSRFHVESVENIGVHYARTLREWRLKFLQQRDAVRALGFDEMFLRKWEYYLAYCEAAFATRTLDDLHLVLTRPCNRSLGFDDAATVSRGWL